MTTAAQVWAYVLPNGKSAGQNLVEEDAMAISLAAQPELDWDEVLENGLTGRQLVEIIRAVFAGETHVVSGQNTAHIDFDSEDGTRVVVAADLEGSARVAVTVDPQP